MANGHHCPASQLGAIFGTGRSGSTWLGTVLNTHPRVAYRFEPFHRLRINQTMRELRGRMEAPDLGEEDIARLAAFLRPSDPLTDKPPFFPKDGTRSLGKKRLWPLARAFRPCAPIFSALYSPPSNIPVVFKEVTMDRVMRNMVQRTSTPVVYLLRHPCAVIRSLLDGQQRKVMASGRQSVLGQLLRDHHPTLAKDWADRADSLPALEKEALLWRLDVETGVEALAGREQGMIVHYEELCEEGPRVFSSIFAHLGLDYQAQTRSFLEDLYAVDSKRVTRGSGEILRSKYFSVIRNPRSTVHQWRETMDPASRNRVLAVVGDSPVYLAGKAAGVWED